jgi:hypothetical protein
MKQIYSKNKKANPQGWLFQDFLERQVLFLVVTLHELVDTSCCVDQILLASIKRVRH